MHSYMLHYDLYVVCTYMIKQVPSLFLSIWINWSMVYTSQGINGPTVVLLLWQIILHQFIRSLLEAAVKLPFRVANLCPFVSSLYFLLSLSGPFVLENFPCFFILQNKKREEAWFVNRAAMLLVKTPI